MTAPHILDPAGLLSEALSEASPDMMRHLLVSGHEKLPIGGQGMTR